MLGRILLIVNEDWTVRHRASGRIVTPSSNPAATGEYDLYSNGNIRVTDEPWDARLISHSISSREVSFRQGVRERDGKCVITGQPNRLAAAGSWIGYHGNIMPGTGWQGEIRNGAFPKTESN
ncbi:hypothetical protein P175DRAFT_0233505 [Aspergillus ochraceoroseus IBT 24754]|uniref:Uncharacterized protein n=2 Tax=Aspergillus ochraceoroseus TaxID=138278 RepID=A0A2T5LX08_9EURO|nr:uncharacterized protein P175DRAFT_0233505 [Aspergillus ochraceoroseus IBT 24754]KKK19601.1 hypothetical protein AOCH_001299 [Aspergillus ochraceoroseus]PTU20807.1 hypothetical protein P175DRAFT_0233505 [Aspergillus ochraceoroseus IBT 24754]